MLLQDFFAGARLHRVQKYFLKFFKGVVHYLHNLNQIILWVKGKPPIQTNTFIHDWFRLTLKLSCAYRILVNSKDLL